MWFVGFTLVGSLNKDRTLKIDTMKLLLSQKDELYDIIEEEGFSPLQFDFKEQLSRFYPQGKSIQKR